MIFDSLISAEHQRQLTNLGALRGAVNVLVKAKGGYWDKYSYYCDKRSASLRAGDDEMYKSCDKNFE